MNDMTSMTLKDRVYTTVLHDVINGVYTVDSVISEKKLSEQLRVSKAPVREALVQLCAEGVLRSVPRQGYVVVRYSKRDVCEILQYRVMLECGSLRTCFDQITPIQLRHLESISESEILFHRMRDAKDFWNRTTNFHLTLISLSGNEFIYSCLNSALSACMRAYQQLCLNKLQEDLSDPPMLHREIVNSIRQGDRERAVEVLRRDINTFFTPDESM